MSNIICGIRVTKKNAKSSHSIRNGMLGWTIATNPKGIEVRWDNGEVSTYSREREEKYLSRADEFNSHPKNTMDSLKNLFVLGLATGSKRAFRKAGITNGDDMLTQDGMQVFLTWLLHDKFAAEFQKDVVDAIIEEMKEEKGCK